MAKAGRENTPAPQQSKCGQQSAASADDPRYWELGSRDDFVSLASRREWKERLRRLIDTHYFKTPLKERQWFNVLDLANECARDPRTTEIDNEKRNGMVGFLCRAINRGEFKDAKGRMQVANLHPSPHALIRLDLKWLAFDQLLAFAKEGFLFIRRKECIECFFRNDAEFSKAWLPSELTGPDVLDAHNQPLAPPASHHKPPLVEERWKVIGQPRHRQRELRRAWTIMDHIWPEGPPLSMSIRQIADYMTQHTKPPSNTNPETINVYPNHHTAGGFSETTVKRLLKA
jgi:hypothetical protein